MGTVKRAYQLACSTKRTMHIHNLKTMYAHAKDGKHPYGHLLTKLLTNLHEAQLKQQLLHDKWQKYQCDASEMYESSKRTTRSLYEESKQLLVPEIPLTWTQGHWFRPRSPLERNHEEATAMLIHAPRMPAASAQAPHESRHFAGK